jgi:glutathione S-transferase
MSEITFYYAPMSSASPVVWALAELAVPHRAVKIDLKGTEHKKSEFLKLNPNGKVPTLVVDGTPMFEALAIMQWLGDRYGAEKKLWPAADEPARLQALAWSTWGYVSFGSAIGRLFIATSQRLGPEFRNEPQAELARKEINELLGILDARLAQKKFLLSDQFSLADLIVSGLCGYAAMSGVKLDGHDRVQAWLASCQDRPAFKAAMSA